MQKFIVVYLAPAAGLEAWMQIDPEIRESEQKEMEQNWSKWVQDHEIMQTAVTAGVGKTKRITKEGIEDTNNDMMLYSIVEGNSAEEVAEQFKDHPHFGIPDGSIEIMPISFLPNNQ